MGHLKLYDKIAKRLTIMGLLHNAGSMYANGFWIAPLEPLFVYRIECETTGHYYIGQTNDIKERAYQHYMAIIDVSMGIGENHSPFQLVAGSALKRLFEVGRKQRLDQFILKNLSIHVLAMASDSEAVNNLESFYITKYSKDPMCMNKGVKIFERKFPQKHNSKMLLDRMISLK